MEILNDIMRQPGGIAAVGMFAHNEAQNSVGRWVVPTEEQLAELAPWLPDANDPRCWASREEAQIRVDAGVARDIESGQAQLQTIRRFNVAWQARKTEIEAHEGQAIWTAQHTCDVCGEINSLVQRDPRFWAGMYANERYQLQQHLKRLPQAHMECLTVYAWERARRASLKKVGRKTLADHAAALVDTVTA